MKLVRVAFVVPTSEAEFARAWLVEHAPAGFEERAAGDRTELAVYVAPEAADPIAAAFPQATVEAVAGGWEDGWKAFHRPVVVGGLWVGPPWIEPPTDLPTVVVDPGRAFGTGGHPTTRACIEALSRLEPGSLLDAGCGSGAVAVAGVRLGFAPVRAVDLDPVAVEVAAETALRNRVAVDVWQADVLRDPLPPSDVVVANIELAVVEQLLGLLVTRLAVTSGYPDRERPTAPLWEHVDRVELDGWAADVLARRQ
jgi:ribosomal protein L11 methyltransferase